MIQNFLHEGLEIFFNSGSTVGIAFPDLVRYKRRMTDGFRDKIMEKIKYPAGLEQRIAPTRGITPY